MLCAGCGEPLSTVPRRGRPTRYHNATCRQRGRRARLTAHHNRALSILASLESAASELRHAILTDKDTSAAYTRLTRATADLAQQLAPTTPPDPSGAETPVTKSVTISPPTSKPAPAATPPSARAHHRYERQAQPRQARDNITAPQPVVTKTVDMNKSIGQGWTLVQHHGDADASIWHVQRNDKTVGTVRRSYDLSTNTRGWEARTATYDHVRATGTLAASRRNDNLWRTRDAAAAGIATHFAHHRPVDSMRQAVEYAPTGQQT